MKKKEISCSNFQEHLFQISDLHPASNLPPKKITLNRQLIESWQEKVLAHQKELFQGGPIKHEQVSLFNPNPSNESDINQFEPLKLKPLPLNFWKWPSSPHSGPAIYLVMDRPKHLNQHILLYIGETIAAERRWKGEHDCKSYLASYCEALSKVRLPRQLSIRFWTDVPLHTKSRRQLEQFLIQQWLPPFNKETRTRWATPFTADVF